MGYITLAVWGFPNALEWGTKSAVAHNWADGLHNPCCLGDPQRFKGGKSFFCFLAEIAFFVGVGRVTKKAYIAFVLKA